MDFRFLAGLIGGTALGIFVATELVKPWAWLLVASSFVAKYLLQKIFQLAFENEMRRAKRYGHTHPLIWTFWHHARLWGRHDADHDHYSPLHCRTCRIIK